MKRRSVDIIVAVDDDVERLARCVRSVERCSSHFRLILVESGTSGTRVGELLRALSARAPQTTVLRGDGPRSFGKGLNRALAASRNDVVLLEPGCVVTSGWLDRLRQCAASDPAIGIATALSNVVGEVGSALGSGRASVEAIDSIGRAVEAAAVPLYPDLPFATQCGVYVRREALRRIGAFDERPGEPDAVLREFVDRARRAGYRSVLCDDAFVYGSAVGPHPTNERGGAKPSVIEPICGAIRSQAALLAESGKPGVLHVLHGRGGGTEKHVQELIATARGEFRHYLLRTYPDRWRLLDLNATPCTAYDCTRESGHAGHGWLGMLCAWLAIDVMHVHSLVGTGDDLVGLLDEAGLPYAYSVHDMYTACPTVYLIGANGEYCNATTDPLSCQQCLSGCEAYRAIDIVGWRVRNRRFLERAKAIFAPSAWARDTLRAYYPGIDVTMAPHAPSIPVDEARSVTNGWQLPVDDCAHVGVLGAIGPEKGARHVEAMAARIRALRLPLRLVVIGYTDRDNRSQSEDGVLTVHGRYDSNEVAALFDHYGIALTVFPTVWPETFSYTLGESWLAGRPALVPPRGALQERVLATGAGWIMRGWPDVDAILDQLADLTAPGSRDELARRAALARRAVRHATAAGDPVRKFYFDVHAAMRGRPRPEVSRRRIHEAACRALDLEPMPSGAARTIPTPAHTRHPASRLLRIFRS